MDRDKLHRSFSNINASINSNMFVSIHSADPGEMQSLGYPQPKFGNPYNPNDLSTWMATVPENTIVILFTPTNKYLVSNDENEIMIRQMLSNPHWIHDSNIFTESGQLFMPGDKMYNQQMIFEEETYWDVWHLPNRKMGTSAQAPAWTSFKLQTINTDKGRDADNKFHSITTEYLLESLKGDKTVAVDRIIYIWSCNPPTNTKGIGSLMELPYFQQLWVQFGFNHAQVEGILQNIHKFRNECEKFGKQQFGEMILTLGTPRGKIGSLSPFRPSGSDIFKKHPVEESGGGGGGGASGGGGGGVGGDSGGGGGGDSAILAASHQFSSMGAVGQTANHCEYCRQHKDNVLHKGGYRKRRKTKRRRKRRKTKRHRRRRKTNRRRRKRRKKTRIY